MLGVIENLCVTLESGKRTLPTEFEFETRKVAPTFRVSKVSAHKGVPYSPVENRTSDVELFGRTFPRELKWVVICVDFQPQGGRTWAAPFADPLLRFSTGPWVLLMVQRNMLKAKRMNVKLFLKSGSVTREPLA